MADFVTQLEALLAKGDGADTRCFLYMHAPALLDVVKAAYAVAEINSELSEALRRLDEEEE